MLSHWLIALTRNRKAESELPGRVRAAIAEHLYYRPEQVLFHRFGPGAWTLSVSANTRTWAIDAPYELSEQSFAVVAGVPTLESLAKVDCSVPASMAACVREHGAQYTFANIGGTFSLGMLDRDRVMAFSDFSGYNSCYYLNTDDYFAVGNLPGLVAAFRPGFPDRHQVDVPTLAWTVGTTMVIGDRTPFADVRRLRTGHFLEVPLADQSFDVGDVRLRPFSPMHFDHPAGLESFEAIEYDQFIESTSRRVRWCRDQGIRFRSHLTGGRDTRAIAGVLGKCGQLDAVMEFVTNGTEKNGDVLLARQLAKALGIEDRHDVRSGSKIALTLTAKRFANALARSSFVFSGQLTPFDGRPRPTRYSEDFATLMGGGGEIYRQEWGPSSVLRGACGIENALNLFVRYDRLGILSKACEDFHRTVVGEELGYLKDREVVNLTGAFYLEERMANWGSAHFGNNPTTQFPLLLSLELARSVLGLSDVAEHVHFEILRHCDDALLKIPFLNRRWSTETEARAQTLGYPTDPLTVDVERNFPWQFIGYRRYRDELISFCLEHGIALRDCVPVQRLEALRRSPVEPFSSSSVKALYGLVSAIFFAERGYIRARDLERGSPIGYSGNGAGEAFRSVCEYGGAGSESWLYQDLVRRIETANGRRT